MDTEESGLEMSKHLCQTKSQYNMYQVNKLVLSVQLIYRNTQSNR